MWPLPAIQALICLTALYLRDVRMAGTAIILLANWSACTLFVQQSGEPYPWLGFFVCDYLAAVAILIVCGRPTLWQGIIGFLYGAELVCHAARGSLDTPASIYYGWYFLHYAAWLQVVALIGWGGYALACRFGLFNRRASRLDPILGGYRTASKDAR